MELTRSNYPWHSLAVFFVIGAFSSCRPAQGFTVSEETALRTSKSTGYSKDVRPSAVTDVSLMLHVTTIAGVDITSETFSLSGWWSMRWTDDRLNWSATAYPSIPVVQYNPDKIWTPVLVVSNSINDLSAIDEDTIPIRVDRNGIATWNPPALVNVGCTMDVTYFPFDTQTCGVEVTSSGYTIQEMDVDVFNGGLSFRYFSENGEWTMMNTYTERAEYSEDGYSYARVTFFFDVTRKPLYYGLNMLLPVMICSALTLCVFLLPAESGEKIGYCLTVLLAFMVILTLVATDLPTTATNTSVLEIYIAIVLILGGLSVFFSICVLNIFFKPDDKPVPDFVRKLTLVGMRICCYDSSCCSKRVEPKKESFRSKRPNTVDRRPDSLQEFALSEMRGQQSSNSAAIKFALERANGQTPESWYRKDSTVTEEPIADPDNVNKPRLIKQQTMYGFRPQNSIGPADEVTWQMAARVMDGVLFRVYSLFLIVSSVIILAVLTSTY